MTHRGQDSSMFRIQGVECYKPCSCRRPTATPPATPFLLLHYPPFDPLLLRPSLHRLPPLLQRLPFLLLLSPPPPLRCRRPSVSPLRAVSSFPHVRNRRRSTALGGGRREACGRCRDFQQPARHGKEARPAKRLGPRRRPARKLWKGMSATVTVLHDYVGCRTFEVPYSTNVGAIKELIYPETGFPVAEQCLFYQGRELFDCVKVGELQSSQNHVFLNLLSKGLKGGGRFGQTTPPLVDFLKDILRRYPEGGQILKELIQNAEDAEATEVRFLYDETQYGTESLWSKDMAQYQGPALYVYNNAVFTPEDWHGIQEIARSRKKDDPLKVGRFGIGFNSVYHITDVPSIFSGDQIGMLDPHQKLFGPSESGQCWNLKDDIKEISELTDQFAPFIAQDAVYITSETYPRSLFPGLEGRLLADNLKPQMLAALKEASKSRGRQCTQLQLLNPERFARLIKEVMNTLWPSSEITVQWFPTS
ncbi:sacsin, partial [Crotalus adamanteus]